MIEISNDRKLAHALMIFVVCVWGFDYVPAKWGLSILSPMSLLLCKYCCGFVVMLVFKIATKNKNFFRLKDLPIFILCSMCGEILYFACEYTAMDYLPVSLITIVLAFVPVLSVIIERVVFKVKSNKLIVVSVMFCIVGVILVIGADFRIIFEGRFIGYLLAFGAVLSWNVYNYITASLDHYDSGTLAITQMVCTLLLCAPMALHSFPPISDFTPQIVCGILWMGIVDSGFGFMIMVYGLQKLGPTTSAVYSNFLPVTATIFGAIGLHETISPLQIVGGIIVIATGYIVIREKGRLDEERLKNE